MNPVAVVPPPSDYPGRVEQQRQVVPKVNTSVCGRFDRERSVAVLNKVALVGAGGDARDVPDVLDGIAADGWVSAFTAARDEVERVWADEAILDRSVTLPWATLSGRVALEAYTHEFTVHSWDLAHATGRRADLDSDLAVQALEAFPKFAPPGERGEQGPFGSIVAVPDDADVYTRLAAYLGRRP